MKKIFIPENKSTQRKRHIFEKIIEIEQTIGNKQGEQTTPQMNKKAQSAGQEGYP
jgi:hypothetical protein